MSARRERVTLSKRSNRILIDETACYSHQPDIAIKALDEVLGKRRQEQDEPGEP